MRTPTRLAVAASAALALSGCREDTPRAKTAQNADMRQEQAQLARAQVDGDAAAVTAATRGRAPELFASFTGPMPTGVAVSAENRVFVTFPRWGDPAEFTVAEVTDGRAVPYPNADVNKAPLDNTKPATESPRFTSVQTVEFDRNNRLWLVDTGSINFQPINPAAAQLLCVDLKTNAVTDRIGFNNDVVLKTTYLNDIRFDMNRGPAGTAYITDSSDGGPNGIIVVDLATKESWRRLNDHPSVKADTSFDGRVEGMPLRARPGQGKADAYVKIGCDGIALGNDGKWLYYTPLASHRLYRVSTDALADRNRSDVDVANTVEDLSAGRDFASDGIRMGPDDTLYLTDYEHHAVRTWRQGGGGFGTLTSDPRLIWPDTMAIGPDGYLYLTVNQLNRQPNYQNGQDKRQPPYSLFRVKLGNGDGGTGNSAAAR